MGRGGGVICHGYLKEILCFRDPRFKGGIPDFMEILIHFSVVHTYRKVHWRNPKLKSLNSMPSLNLNSNLNHLLWSPATQHSYRSDHVISKDDEISENRSSLFIGEPSRDIFAHWGQNPAHPLLLTCHGTRHCGLDIRLNYKY